MKMIQINGAEGGGQILRSALSLSMLTGRSFRMVNIRGKRSKPGLKRQHLMCVQAAASVCDAAVDGGEMNSTEIVFSPDLIKGGEYVFKIGSAGSTTLLFQTLLPALLAANTVSKLELHGGTHNPMAPTADYIEQCFLPNIRKMGGEVYSECIQHGFAPAGGGIFRVSVFPNKKLLPLNLVDRGELVSKKIEIIHANVPGRVMEREAKMFHQLYVKYGCKNPQFSETYGELNLDDGFTIRDVESDGSGNCMMATASYDNVSNMATSFGMRSVTAESVAKSLWREWSDTINSEATIEPKLADQLLLPIAVAGSGSLSTMKITNHIKTNIHVIEAFLDIKFCVEQREHDVLISLH